MTAEIFDGHSEAETIAIQPPSELPAMITGLFFSKSREAYDRSNLSKAPTLKLLSIF